MSRPVDLDDVSDVALAIKAIHHLMDEELGHDRKASFDALNFLCDSLGVQAERLRAICK